MEANKERQIEEIEALTSIYEDLFELENEDNYTGMYFRAVQVKFVSICPAVYKILPTTKYNRFYQYGFKTD